MEDTSKKLNKQQLQAVKHGEGPLLIIAGAGTGKTTVITERLKYLIQNKKAKPEEILALTFTEKAATEMEERVDEAMPLSYGDIWIMTFHSFCDQILRQEGLHIGLPSNFKLMTKEKSIDLFKRNLFNFSLEYFRPLGNPNKFIDSILSHFSRLQDEVVTPDDYSKWIDKKIKNNKDNSEENLLELKKWKELAVVYKEYDQLKLNEAKFDFGDLIIKTVELFKSRSNILKNYQQKFKYILVDEYQDTNFAQNEVINKLVQKYKNITIVGDDNQSIYRFRGAAISNILQFTKTYPEAKTISLSQNYRSTQVILDSAYKLIKNNDPDTLEFQLGISKKLMANGQRLNSKIEFIYSNTGREEAEEVAIEINSLITDHGSRFTFGDMAILVRANNHAESFIREFERRGIPHQFLGPSKLFEKPEIFDLISYLKVLYNTEDSTSLYRLLSSDICDISSLELIKLSNTAKKQCLSLFDVIVSSDDSKIKKVTKLFEKHLNVINKQSAGEILYDYVKEIGIYESLIKNSDELKAKNISKLFDIIKEFENNNKDSSVMAVVDYIDLLSEVGDSPSITDGDWHENNAVNILTVHSSKGLEFPVVFLVNLVSERFPSRERHEQIPIPEELIKEVLPKGDYHMQEERRLFYVGMTRAQERLYLTAANYYGDGVREKKISPFVMEALGETAISHMPYAESKTNLGEQNYKTLKHTPYSIKLRKVEYLSVSQIETFKTCPMHYKLKYIYKLPTPPSASISFGVSIHNTLKEYFETKKDILKIYKDNWIEEGYQNKKHKLEFFKKGENYLLGFIKNSYDSKVSIISLEEKFTLKINESLKIGGTIDRVDDLGKGRYEIIDYKTGANIPTQKEVDKDMQLSFYSLAVSALYKVNPEDIKLSLYYFEGQQKITTRRTKEDLDNLKDEILEIKKEIEESDFKCNNSYFCQQGCEFSMFCKSK